MITISVKHIAKEEYNCNQDMVDMVLGHTIMAGLGCSKAELDRWVEVDCYVKNPHYKTSAPMKLYNPSIMATSDETIQSWRQRDLKNGVIKRIGKSKERIKPLIEIGKIALIGQMKIWNVLIEIRFKDIVLEGNILVKVARNEVSAIKKVTESIKLSYEKFISKKGVNDRNIVAALRRALKKPCFFNDFFKAMISGPQDYSTLNKYEVESTVKKLFNDYTDERDSKKNEKEVIALKKLEIEKERKYQEFLSIKETIEKTPEYINYPSLFPLARSMKRHFVFHAGPTNSGKTHGALKELMEAKTGIYLAPLRLMAMEAHDRMNNNGVITNMATGEERFTYENANHMSCTIEMMETSEVVDICIIDEAQLITDEDRGWAWTKAIVGCPAKKIIMTGSPEVGDYIKKLVLSLGDTYEEVRFKRLNALDTIKRPVTVDNLKPGDAIIAFSRNKVLELHHMLNNEGYNVACIYGALSPEVRRKESERFLSGEAEILVATDAIGMGLNLPIKRVLFSNIKKYDGYSFRTLYGTEIRQIAGRAGRFNADPEKNIPGEAGVFYDPDDRYSANQGDISTIHCALRHNVFSKQSRINGYPVVPTQDMVRIISEEYKNNLVETLEISEKLLTINENNDFTYSFTNNNREVAEIIRKNSPRTVWEQYEYIGCPVRLNNDDCNYIFTQYLKRHVNDKSTIGVLLPDDIYVKGLDAAETISNIASMYMWLSEKYATAFVAKDKASAIKKNADKEIEYCINQKYEKIRLRMRKKKELEKIYAEQKENISKILVEEYKTGLFLYETVEYYVKTIYEVHYDTVTPHIVNGLKTGYLDENLIPTNNNKKKKKALYKRICRVIRTLNELGISFKNQEAFIGDAPYL